jgi:hypothetical protein
MRSRAYPTLGAFTLCSTKGGAYTFVQVRGALGLPITFPRQGTGPQISGLYYHTKRSKNCLSAYQSVSERIAPYHFGVSFPF